MRRQQATSHKSQATSLDPQAAYELWAESYPPYPHNRLMEIEQQTVLGLMPDVNGRRVLDAGCGTGRYMQLLSDAGARVTGVDLSASMLALGHQRFCVRGDMTALPVRDASVDVVVSGLALGDVSDLASAIVELARALCPHGTLIYSVLHPDGGERGWSRTFTSGGQVFAVSGYWHSCAVHRAALARASFAIEAWREPAAEPAGPPVALVVRAKRGD